MRRRVSHERRKEVRMRCEWLVLRGGRFQHDTDKLAGEDIEEVRGSRVSWCNYG